MALKYKFKSKDEIPAEQRRSMWSAMALGCWMPRAWWTKQADEFRANNIALSKQLEEHEEAVRGHRSGRVRKLAEEKQRLEEAQQLKAGEVDKVVENRLKTAKTEWDKQFAAVTTERDSLNARLTAIRLTRASSPRRRSAGCGRRRFLTSRRGRELCSSW